ncbi:DNA repair protein RecO [Parvibacter caecicola]|uniref:DNA repair protein RecO n=1 Tax=Parvibacter caecicola TaxID=747645 RepID=UPI00249BA801|nr:DNA repair protein RecO [Parvibacter caecicola]
MAGQSFWVRGLVLRKTKLGESDLIVELLNDEGCLVRAVAKGARKPKSSFASRLELGNSVEILCASGRGLAIVQECRLVSARMGLRQDYEQLVCTEVLLELLSKCTQEDLPQPKLLAVSEAALDALAAAPPSDALGLLAAAFLKVLAFVGLRPELRRCVVCGRPAAGATRFSDFEGGVVCAECGSRVEARFYPAEVLSAAAFLLHTPFAQIAEAPVAPETAREVLQMAASLAQVHLDFTLRSLRML